MRTLKVLTYNIHKGFNTTNTRPVLRQIKESIALVHAELVFLQEVSGHPVSQFEYLADKLWPHFAYGKNAVYTSGHHGNAILSKYPIVFAENVDVSTNALENRGLLHVAIELPKRRGHGEKLHAICLHLSLFEAGRKAQIRRLCERIDSFVPPSSPLIVAGDFNDWKELASPILKKTLGLDEAFLAKKGCHARTFPSWLPVLKLDRIYSRKLGIEDAKSLTQGVWGQLSDHAALYAELSSPR